MVSEQEWLRVRDENEQLRAENEGERLIRADAEQRVDALRTALSEAIRLDGGNGVVSTAASIALSRDTFRPMVLTPARRRAIEEAKSRAALRDLPGGP